MGVQKQKKSGGSRKIGRKTKKPSFQRYWLVRKVVQNKIQRLLKRLKRHPNDGSAEKQLANLRNWEYVEARWPKKKRP